MSLQFAEVYIVGDPKEITIANREAFENGGKLILGTEILSKLIDRNILKDGSCAHFRIHSPARKIVIHCGVFDFSGKESLVYAPRWIMEYCDIRPGDSIVLASVDLKLGTFMKIQPQSVDFLDIPNHDEVLTELLPNFSCVMQGQYLRFHYNDKCYDIKILETKPDPAVSLINTNVTVDFAEPVGYSDYAETLKKQHELKKREELLKKACEDAGFVGGRSLGDKKRTITSLDTSAPPLPPPAQTIMRTDLSQKLSDVKPVITSSRSELDALSDLPDDSGFNVANELNKKKFTGKGRRL